MGRPKIIRRWPLDDLLAAMGGTPHEACKRLGLSGSTQQQYRRDGVSDEVADRLAVRAGLHPYEVWPGLVEAHIADLDMVDDERLERRREQNRRYYVVRYATDPEFRAAELERNRRAYQESRAYKIRQSALYQDRKRAEDPEAFRAARRAQERARRERALADDPDGFRAAQRERQRAYRAARKRRAVE